MTTLDDIERTLDADMVVIDDAQGPTSIAGVMGGQRSEVSEATTRVLMEVATWNGPNINRTSNRLNLRCEASARFEKGLSVRQTLEAQAVASKLMVELCGATPVGGTIDVGGPGPDPAPIRLRARKLSALLGTEIPIDRAAADPARAGLRHRARAGRPRRHAAARAPRRHARGRPDRGGRAARRRRQAARRRCRPAGASPRRS